MPLSSTLPQVPAYPSPSSTNEARVFPEPSSVEIPSRSHTISDRMPASARRKGPQARMPREARQILEDEFATNPYPCSWEFDIIAHQANIEVKKVKIWFNNARARKLNPGQSPLECTAAELPNESTHSLNPKLSRESLEALSKQSEEVLQAPQPPLAFYLASSYNEEAASYAAIQAAIDRVVPAEKSTSFVDSSSGSRVGRTASIITSVTSSEGSAPTSYAPSSAGSHVSTFNRERRRGRRRMSWRTSPYTRAKVSDSIPGVEPKELPFFCTFCPIRSFKTKYEWIRHEDSVHALRTTWICCGGKQETLESCPFCGHHRPDEDHMSGHRYQQCRGKPEHQRTFFRRDHFVQHLHHVHFDKKHPSPPLGCQDRLTNDQGHDFGCKDLAMKWRRFGAPMRTDDPMLHCGFCGKRSKDWSERCEHVAEHLMAGGLDRSAWWPDRVENHLEDLCIPEAVGLFSCRYCQKTFPNAEAMSTHTHCRIWSCRFLRTFNDIASATNGPPLCPQFPSPKAHHCYLCGAGYKSSHIEHAQQYHKYRMCDQRLYTSEAEFLQHLYADHGASPPQLLQTRMEITQSFDRTKRATFEPLEPSEFLLDLLMPPSASMRDPFISTEPVRTPSPCPTVVETPPPTNRRKPSRSRAEATDSPAKTRKERPTKEKKPPAQHGPRFFRLDPVASLLSSTILFLRDGKLPQTTTESGMEEFAKPYVASLVMASGLVGMVGVRLPVNVTKTAKGVFELGLDLK
ncbi:hypothetical protein P154DRAFT_449674 [Amniculicola lignicola CBS 123094]|uniref:Homeobox domain-containing protein n=1 Tax=Amniculicola lignicola CBS 123094 TaxID=1392246 RepID=A0A6A5W0H2_9PLEO|nr:hypothetical protein P154DRAFT_449674 [Amniculicola lignicola CBS 123094]